MDFLDPEAREVLRAAGAQVGARVRARPVRSGDGRGADPDGAVVRSRSMPQTPTHDLEIGGDWIAFGSVGERAERRRRGPRPAGRQPGRLPGPHPALADARGRPLLRRLPGRAGRHPRRRSATSTRIHDLVTLADKPIHAYSLGRQRNIDAIEMMRIRRGIDDATLEREPSIFTVINSSLAAASGHADAPGDPRDSAGATRSS